METFTLDIYGLEELNWEILQENEMCETIIRHWFKQNFLPLNGEEITQITYH
jgi:hypothetical protein